MNDEKKPFDSTDANRDPLSGQPGAHPIGTGVGAAGAGTVGAVVGGALGGPVGAVVGSVVGSVAGGLAGKGAAEKINPTVEEEYWRNNYTSRPYYEQGHQYETYQPAYRTGYEGYGRYAGTGRTYHDVEPELRQDYESRHGGAGMAWEKAKHATRDAWERVENAMPGRNNDNDVNVYEDRSDIHRESYGSTTRETRPMHQQQSYTGETVTRSVDDQPFDHPERY